MVLFVNFQLLFFVVSTLNAVLNVQNQICVDNLSNIHVVEVRIVYRSVALHGKLAKLCKHQWLEHCYWTGAHSSIRNEQQLFPSASEMDNTALQFHNML